MRRLVFLGSVLFSWIVALVFIDWCANDAIFFQPGRERWFALTVNGTFLISTGLLFFKSRESRRLNPKSTWTILLCFLATLALTRAWAPLVSSISGPPWQNRQLGMPVSSNTPFQDSLWAWENPDIRQK